MSLFITSDFHFGHKKILETERFARFKTIEDHDEFIVKFFEDICRKMKQEDAFWFLGDFGRPSEEHIKRLKRAASETYGKCLAILGNHDKEEEQELMEQIFDHVYDVPQFINKRLVLSHLPYLQMNPSCINCHGHLHGMSLDFPGAINASIHVAGYKPITSQLIESRQGKLPKWNMRFLYEYFAPYYKLEQKRPELIADNNKLVDVSASRVLQRLKQQEEQGKIEESAKQNFE